MVPPPGLRPCVLALRSASHRAFRQCVSGELWLRTWVGAARGAMGLCHFSTPGVPLPELGDWNFWPVVPRSGALGRCSPERSRRFAQAGALGHLQRALAQRPGVETWGGTVL